MRFYRKFFSKFFFSKIFNTFFSSRVESQLLLENEARILMKQVEVSITVAKTILMRNKWNHQNAIESLNNITFGDQLGQLPVPGDCIG